MNIASTPFPLYFTPNTTPALPTPTTTTATVKMTKLSNSDRNFIEFTRCLHKAKSVVQELQTFSKTVEKQQISSIQQINQYLQASFRKFNHMCKILLIVLSKLGPNVKKERIDSFRQEVVSEWRKVIHIKQCLILLVINLQKDANNIPQPQPQSFPSMMMESDEDSDTTIEPITSSDSSDSSLS